MLEEIKYGIVLFIILIQAESKSQGLVIWVQFVRVDEWWKIQLPQEVQIRFQYSCMS